MSKLQPGDSPKKGPLNAREWNRVSEAGDNFQDRQARGFARPMPPSTRNYQTVVQLRNDCGVNLRRGELLEIEDTLILDPPDNASPWFSGVDPDLTRVGWAIALEPIAYNASSRDYGPALVLGVCLAHVVITSADHHYANRASGQRVLQSALTGSAKILVVGPENPDSEGEFECWVQIMDETNPQPLVRFELVTALSLTGVALARVMTPTLSGDWEYTEPAEFIAVFDPYRPEGMWNGGVGSQGWAYPRGQTYTDTEPEPDDVYAAYDVVWMERPAQILRGTATQHMGASTDWQISVAVTWFDWQGRDPGSTVIVHDPAHSWQDVPTGSDVLAFYNNKDARYEVLYAERVVQEGRAVLANPLCAEPSMITVSDFVGIENGNFLLPPDTLPTTGIINPRGHAGLSGDTVTLRRADNNMPNPTWEIVDVDHHLLQPIVELRLDGLNYQYRTRDIYTETCTTDPNEWVTWLEGDDECPEGA